MYMDKKRHKKDTLRRKKLENGLSIGLKPIASQGNFLSSCLESNPDDKKYQIAKKRYLALLEQAEEGIKKIREIVDEMELVAIQEKKREKLLEQNQERNDYINGDKNPETLKHRQG